MRGEIAEVCLAKCAAFLKLNRWQFIAYERALCVVPAHAGTHNHRRLLELQASATELNARLSHMEFSNESSLRTQGPIRRGLSLRHSSRGLFSLLRPGVMGPCVRRDDLLRDCTRPRPHQRTAQFSHMR